MALLVVVCLAVVCSVARLFVASVAAAVRCLFVCLFVCCLFVVSLVCLLVCLFIIRGDVLRKVSSKEVIQVVSNTEVFNCGLFISKCRWRFRGQSKLPTQTPLHVNHHVPEWELQVPAVAVEYRVHVTRTFAEQHFHLRLPIIFCSLCLACQLVVGCLFVVCLFVCVCVFDCMFDGFVYLLVVACFAVVCSVARLFVLSLAAVGVLFRLC